MIHPPPPLPSPPVAELATTEQVGAASRDVTATQLPSQQRPPLAGSTAIGGRDGCESPGACPAALSATPAQDTERDARALSDALGSDVIHAVAAPNGPLPPPLLIPSRP